MQTPYVDLKSDMELGPVQILHRVMNGTLQPSFSRHIPSQLEKIAKLCLHRDAKLRPAAKSVVEMLTG